jgi:hypothetical protein
MTAVKGLNNIAGFSIALHACHKMSFEKKRVQNEKTG